MAYVPHDAPVSITTQTLASGVSFPNNLGLSGGYPGGTIRYTLQRQSSIDDVIASGRMPQAPDEIGGQTEVVDFKGVIQQDDGDVLFVRSSSSGGYGDPLEREPESVCEDVAEGYVSIERALKDYGVVVRELDADMAEYEIDLEATEAARAQMAGERVGRLAEDAESVAQRYRDGDLDVLDLVRHYGVILDWGTGELLPNTTETFRAMVQRRSAGHWAAVAV
jgi:hypothetical protein